MMLPLSSKSESKSRAREYRDLGQGMVAGFWTSHILTAAPIHPRNQTFSMICQIVEQGE